MIPNVFGMHRAGETRSFKAYGTSPAGTQNMLAVKNQVVGLLTHTCKSVRV